MKALTLCAVVVALSGIASAQIVTITDVVNGYCEDFESGAGAWSDGSGTWMFGTPGGTSINAAASGTEAAFLVPYVSSTDASVSATFDLTAFTLDPTFSMNIHYQTESDWDGVVVEADTGSGFTKIGDAAFYQGQGISDGTDPAFSGDSGGYINVSTAITGGAGVAVVSVRVRFLSDSTVVGGDGCAIDDLKITRSGLPVTPTSPYCEGFEAGLGNWIEGGGLWMTGVPGGGSISAPANGAASAFIVPYAISTVGVLDGLFDCSAFGEDPVFSMNIYYQTEASWDGVIIEADTGSGFSRVGDSAFYQGGSISGGIGIGFEGDSGGYINVATQIPGAAGNANVRIQIVFLSDSSNAFGDGVSIDDVKIEPLGATYPGTNEDLDSFYGINGAPQARVTELNDIVSIAPFDLVSIRHDSAGTWNGVGELVVLGSLDTTPNPPVVVAPNFYLGALSAFAITTPILGPVQLPFGGYNYGFTNPSGALAGTTLWVQAFVIDGSALNGGYASTNALEMQLN